MTPAVVYAAREGSKFRSDGNMVVVACPICHIAYAIPQSLYDAARHHCGPNGWSICCPLGHSWHYNGESKEDGLKRLLEEARLRAGGLASRLEQTEASLRSTKAAATRARRQRDQARSDQAAGTCPCCGKTFKVLAKHMRRQHPDFPPPHEDEG